MIFFGDFFFSKNREFVTELFLFQNTFISKMGKISPLKKLVKFTSSHKQCFLFSIFSCYSKKMAISHKMI